MSRLLFIALFLSIAANGAERQIINRGTLPNDRTGEPPWAYLGKINENFDALWTGDAEVSAEPWRAMLKTPTHRDSVADMVTVTGEAQTNTVLALGRFAKGDSGGGLFYWDPTSTYSTNLGTCFSPLGSWSTGRWVRAFSGPIEASWFAKGDDSTDALAGLTSAISVASASTKKTLHISDGIYRVTSTILVNASDLTIEGNGTIRGNFAGSGALVVINGANSGLTIRGLKFRGYGSGTYDRCFNISSTRGWTVENCDIQGFNEWGVVVDAPYPGVLDYPNEFRNNIISDCGGGIYLPSAEYCHISGNRITGCGVTKGTGTDTGSMPIVGIGIGGAIGNCRIDHNTILHNIYGLYTDGTTGSNGDHTSIANNQINHNQAIGAYISNTDNALTFIDNEILSTVGPAQWAPLNNSLDAVFYNCDNLAVIGNMIGGGLSGHVRLHDVNYSRFVGNVGYGAPYTEVTACTGNVAVANMPYNGTGAGFVNHSNSVHFVNIGNDAVADSAIPVAITSFDNGWTNNGQGYEPLRYWKDYSGTVHVQGVVSNTASSVGTQITTLPVLYRPLFAIDFPTVSGEAFNQISGVRIYDSGIIQQLPGGPTNQFTINAAFQTR